MKKFLKQLLNWIIAFWHWLAEGKVVFMGILVIAAAVFLGMYTWCSEFSIRLAGYGLQLIGMGFAIWGLLKVRKHFKQPLLRKLFLDWVKRFPKWKRTIRSRISPASDTVRMGHIICETWAPDNPEDPIEKRLEKILTNLDGIRETQKNYARSLAELKDSHEEHKKTVIEDYKKMEEKIKGDSEIVHTGDIITALVGLSWLTVGITMSTLAPELFRLIK